MKKSLQRVGFVLVLGLLFAGLVIYPTPLDDGSATSSSNEDTIPTDGTTTTPSEEVSPSGGSYND